MMDSPILAAQGSFDKGSLQFIIKLKTWKTAQKGDLIINRGLHAIVNRGVAPDITRVLHH